jgi:hypothetical protein
MSDMMTALLADFTDKGLHPRVDNDGDIVLTYCDMTYVLCFSKSDDAFSTLLLPNLHEVDADNEISVLRALNEINDRFKWIKACIKQGQACMMIELWMMDGKRWTEAISRCLRISNHALVLFAEALHNTTDTEKK